MRDEKEHRPRHDIQNELTEIREKELATAALESMLIESELLLDIRDLLYEIARNSGVSKWGPKI